MVVQLLSCIIACSIRVPSGVVKRHILTYCRLLTAKYGQCPSILDVMGIVREQCGFGGLRYRLCGLGMGKGDPEK